MTARDLLASVGIGTIVYVLVRLGQLTGRWMFGTRKR
jgi:hypothetical protein